jgi:hypothetical protein
VKLAPYQAPANRDEHPLAAELRDVVITADAVRPRTTQVALGASDLGQPCLRRLAYRLMDEPRFNDHQTSTWAAIVGTAVHVSLADAFATANQRLGRIRYLVEQRVEIRGDIKGTSDLYDFDRATVIDNKVVGISTLKNCRLNGISDEYRVQVHGYGKGYRKLGLPVEHVAIAFYPRAHDIADLHVWSEPYDETVIDDALDRHDKLVSLIDELDVEHHPGHYRLVPATPGRICMYCPWFKAGPDTGTGVTCPGNTETGEQKWN